MKLEGTILVCGEKNLNDHVYDLEAMAQAVEKFNEAAQKYEILGTFGYKEFNDISEVNLEDTSHKVEGVRMEGNEVVAQIEILGTPEGKKLFVEIEKGNIVFRPRGIGPVSEDGVIGEDFKLLSVDAVLKHTDAFANTSISSRGLKKEE